MNIMDIEKTTAEREFLQYLHGYPGEPEWLTALLYGKKSQLEPDMAEMEQVRKQTNSAIWVYLQLESFSKLSPC